MYLKARAKGNLELYYFSGMILGIFAKVLCVFCPMSNNSTFEYFVMLLWFQNALITAVEAGHENVVRYLVDLNMGVDLDNKASMEENKVTSPLILAVTINW